MEFTHEEIAGGIDKDLPADKRASTAVLVTTLLASTAIFAVLMFKAKTKPPTLH